MITLAAASQKGGVAKATTNLAIGAKLVEDGARVLYIDLDPQMNLSTTLKAQTGGVLSSLDVLTGEAGVAAAAQTIDGYDAVPASRLNGKADDLMPSVGKDYRLRKALEAVAENYDYAILDTPPALGTLTVNALTAASWVVIPAQADAYSLDGVTDLAATIQAIREYTNPRPEDRRHSAHALQPAHLHLEDHPRGCRRPWPPSLTPRSSVPGFARLRSSRRPRR